MSNDRNSHRIAVAIFAIILAAAMMVAAITTLEGVDTRYASNVAQPGTIGLAKPHPPLDRAPGEAVRN
jgi:hypothetical protein